jgi:hypothetical protein
VNAPVNPMVCCDKCRVVELDVFGYPETYCRTDECECHFDPDDTLEMDAPPGGDTDPDPHA